MKSKLPRLKINSIGMKFTKIPAGEFLMGSTAEEVASLILQKIRYLLENSGGKPDLWNLWGWIPFIRSECPQHWVEISRPFSMGIYPVTVGQFRRFVEESSYQTEGEANKSGSFGLNLNTGLVELKPEYTWRSGDNPGDPPKWLVENVTTPSGFTQTDDHPVVCVSCNDAQKFCEWLSKKECVVYRLPTEAEWEYACRAGTTTRYYFGDEEAGLRKAGNVADQSLQKQWNIRLPGFALPEQPPYAESWIDGFPFTSPVGTFTEFKEGRNAFGLYDMLGNVGEWCTDWFSETYYADSPSVDPQGPDSPPVFPPSGVNWPRINPLDPGSALAVPPQPLRVVRGGVWLDPEFAYRSADRGTHLRHPVMSAADIGFRVVRETQQT